MTGWVVASIAALLLLSGCAAAPDATTRAAEANTALPDAEVHVFKFHGNVIEDEVGELGSHSQGTEQVLWEVQKVGFKMEVGEDVKELEVALQWDATSMGALKIDLHSHNHTTMKCCIRHESPMDADNPKCIRVGATDLHPGDFEPMVRAGNWTVNARFTLTVVTVGAPVKMLDERHGHDRVEEVTDIATGDPRKDDFPPVEPCVRWPALGASQ